MLNALPPSGSVKSGNNRVRRTVVTGYTGHAPAARRVRSPRLHQHSCGESISLFLALVAYLIRRTYSLLLLHFSGILKHNHWCYLTGVILLSNLVLKAMVASNSQCN